MTGDENGNDGEKMKKAVKSRKLDVRFISLSLQASQSRDNLIVQG